MKIENRLQIGDVLGSVGLDQTNKLALLWTRLLGQKCDIELRRIAQSSPGLTITYNVGNT